MLASRDTCERLLAREGTAPPGLRVMCIPHRLLYEVGKLCMVIFRLALVRVSRGCVKATASIQLAC